MDTPYFYIWVMFALTYLCQPIRGMTGKVLLVSFDGFRWDYLDMVPGLENFPAFAEAGTSAEYMNNTFTTLTFSTHYSMATGLYQESHGVVSNYMYDPVFQEEFYPGCKTCNDQKWWQGQPIWITATLQAKKVGGMFWAGTEVSFDGVLPEIVQKYDSHLQFEDRVDIVLDWFTDNDIDLGLLYFDQPDKSAHKYGPRSPEVASQIRYADEIMGYLMSGITARGLDDSLNVLVVSDHGCANMSLDRTVAIPDHVDWSLVEHFTEVGAICHVFCKEGKIDEVHKSLDNSHPHMKAYKRENIPHHWHYSNNRRIGDVLLVMDEHWSCTQNLTFAWNKNLGTHGYDNRLMSMKPIFMARGPDIKPGHRIKPFMSLDIYPLTAQLLGVIPAENNGSMAIVQDMLRYNGPRSVAVMDISVSAATHTTTHISAMLVCFMFICRALLS